MWDLFQLHAMVTLYTSICTSHYQIIDVRVLREFRCGRRVQLIVDTCLSMAYLTDAARPTFRCQAFPHVAALFILAQSR